MRLKHINFIQNPLHKKFITFKSSIYSRVIYIIIISSLILFVSFGILFRSVNEGYMKRVIRQSGTNVSMLVSSALYHSMLENDRSRLQNTLDIINKMSGIEDVNLYDKNENLAYSSFSDESVGHSNPNCNECHESITAMFPGEDNFYKILEIDTECEMKQNSNTNRHLLIRTPILNEKSCYTAHCHAHFKDEKILGTLIIKVPLTDLDDIQKELSTVFYFLAALMTLLLLVILIIFTRKKIKNPLKNLISASEAVANGDRSKRLKIEPNQLNDIRMVSMAFNHMLDSLSTATAELQNWSQQLEYKVRKKSEELGHAQNELVNIEKIASLGKLSLSVAHEINNPLSGILIYTKLVHKQLLNENFELPKKTSILKHLKMIENETKRCGDIVKSLLDFSRKDQNLFEVKHLHEILKETCDLMEHSMKMLKIDFIKDFAAINDCVNCSPNQIKQACIAILVNSTEAISENGEIIIKTNNPDENNVKIEISDNGFGISQDDILHIFEPFFSTKQNMRGTGLGLSIVHGIVQNHSGKIGVTSKNGNGTVISILLPLKKKYIKNE